MVDGDDDKSQDESPEIIEDADVMAGMFFLFLFTMFVVFY